MSVWHRPQLSLVMKKFAGMVRCTFVSPDDGKNGLDGPAPSSFIDAGTTDGLRMMFVFFARAADIVAATGTATAAMTATAQAVTTGARSPGAPGRRIAGAPAMASGPPPASDSAICTGNSHRHRPAAPTTVIRRPKAMPTARMVYAMV